MLLSICWAPQLLPKDGSPAGKKEKSRDRDATGKRVAREYNAYFQRESFIALRTVWSEVPRGTGMEYGFSLSPCSTLQQQPALIL